VRGKHSGKHPRVPIHPANDRIHWSPACDDRFVCSSASSFCIVCRSVSSTEVSSKFRYRLMFKSLPWENISFIGGLHRSESTMPPKVSMRRKRCNFCSKLITDPRARTAIHARPASLVLNDVRPAAF